MSHVWVVMHGYPYEGPGGEVEEVLPDGDRDWVLDRFHKRIEKAGNVRYTGPASVEQRSSEVWFFDGDWEWFSLERRAVTPETDQ